MENITIRHAVPEDVPFIARCVLAAAGIRDMEDAPTDDSYAKGMEEICAMEHSLYCWNHVRMAVDSQTGHPVGCMVAYDGRRYARARELTFSYAREHLGWSMEPDDMETCKDEYYLDSLAILPKYRGRNIGKMLIEDAVSQGLEASHNRFTLIADKEAVSLQSYYSQIGFTPEEEILFFGRKYIRMVRKVL